MKKHFLRATLTAAVLASSGIVAASMTTAASAGSMGTTTVNFAYDFPGPDMELIPIVVGQDQGLSLIHI